MGTVYFSLENHGAVQMDPRPQGRRLPSGHRLPGPFVVSGNRARTDGIHSPPIHPHSLMRVGRSESLALDKGRLPPKTDRTAGHQGQYQPKRPFPAAPSESIPSAFHPNHSSRLHQIDPPWKAAYSRPEGSLNGLPPFTIAFKEGRFPSVLE